MRWLRITGIIIGTLAGAIIAMILAFGLVVSLPIGWPRVVAAIIAILLVLVLISRLRARWPRVVGIVIAIPFILFLIGLLLSPPETEDETSPESQPTIAATVHPQPTATQSIPSPSRQAPTATAVPPTATPEPTATPMPTVTPKATVAPCINGITVPNPQDNPGLVADCKALLQARDTLAGSATLNWSGDRAITYWDGIIVGGEPLRVTTMVLSDRKLSGTIPPELAALANLQELDLHNNQLSGPIPLQLGTLVNLQGLWLYSNQLTGPIPPQLGALTNLSELALHDNQLSGPIPPQMGTLVNLQGLWLYSNQLTGSIPPQLSAVTSLQVLDLRDNQLSGTIPPQLGMLTNLQGLGLSGNRLSGTVPPQLDSLTNLQGLWLAGNALTGCLPEGLHGVATNDFTELGIPFCAAKEAASPTSQPTAATARQPEPTEAASPTLQPTATTSQPEPAARTVYVGNTDGDGVSLRRTRDPADRIAAYPDGTQFVVLGPDISENGITWKHVRAPDGKVGYVPAQYTVPELPTTATAGPTPTVTPSTVTAEPTVAPLPVIAAKTLARAYEANKATADQKYKERRFRIIGNISSIGSLFGKSIMLADGEVSCSINDQHARDISSLRVGQQVTLQGKIGGKTLFLPIRVEDCIVLPAITVYVGNTGGDGVSLRRSRNPADRIAPYPDGTQFVVLGPDTSENGITWKHVRAPDGTVGYIPVQYAVSDGLTTATIGTSGENTRESIIATFLPIQVTATKLIRDYEANEITADQKYKGKLALMTGKIEAISEVLGEKYVSMDAGFLTFSSLLCYFDDRDTNDLISLKKDLAVNLLGKIDGYSAFGNLIVRECTVVP